MHDAAACFQPRDYLLQAFIILYPSNGFQCFCIEGLHTDFKTETAGIRLLEKKTQQLLTQRFRYDFKLERLMKAVFIHIACNFQGPRRIGIKRAVQQLDLLYITVL